MRAIPVGRRQRGQILPLFALSLTALVLGAAIVVDGGYAYAQQRNTQNAADFAAMAGTRIIGEKLTGSPPGAGTAANVEASIRSALDAHDAQLVNARYVDQDGVAVGNVVGAGSIPSSALGVVVEARTNWRPFLLGVIGVVDWQATTTATAETPGESVGGGVMPVGIDNLHFDGMEECPLTDLDDCVTNLTPGDNIAPGNFGWLSFGVNGQGQKCDWLNSLGMTGPPDDPDSCDMNKPYLQSQIGPPANSHGCCTEIEQPGSVDLIGGLTGNKPGPALDFYIEHRIPVWVPIYDEVTDNGSHADFHIVGFGAIVFTESEQNNGNHAKWLKGAAIDYTCPPALVVPDHDYCRAPAESFTINVTGEVRLVR